MKMFLCRLFNSYPLGAYEVNYAHVQAIKDALELEREGRNRPDYIHGVLATAKIVLPPQYFSKLK